MSEGSNICARFECPDLPPAVYAAVICGCIPYFITTSVAWTLLKKVQFKFARLPSLVSTLDYESLTLNPFSYGKWAPCYVRFYKAAGYLPIVFAFAWALEAYLVMKVYYVSSTVPFLVAGTILTFALELLIGGYGLAHWRHERFRFTRVVQVTLFLCLAMMIALQLVYTYKILNDLWASYTVFMAYNLAPLFAALFLHEFIDDPLTFTSFLHLHANDKEKEVRAATRRQSVRRLVMWCYLASWGVLLAFSAAAKAHYDSLFGFQVSLSILFCDFATIGHHLCNLQSSPASMNGLAVFARIVLFISGTERWFLGVSVNFVVFASVLIWHIIDTKNPLLSSDEALDKAVGGLESALEAERLRQEEKRAAEAAQDAHHGAGITGNLVRILDVQGHVMAVMDGVLTRVSFVRSPIFALTFLIAVFVAYIGVAIYGDLTGASWTQSLFPDINLFTKAHPQYEYGLFALLILVAGTLWIYAYRIYAVNGYTFQRRRVLVAEICFLIVSITGSVFLSRSTGSALILNFGIYLPLLAVFGTFAYTTWASKDYHWNTWLVLHQKKWDHWQAEVEKRKTRERNIAQGLVETEKLDEKSAGNDPLLANDTHMGARPGSVNLLWIIPATKDFVSGKHERSDYALAVLISLVVGIIIALGIQLQYYYDSETANVIAEFVGIAVATTFFLLKWFNTFQIGLFNPLLLSLLILHAAIQLHELDVELSWVLGLAFLHPSGTAFVMAMYSWKAQNWQITRRQVMVLSASLALLASWLIAFTFLRRSYAIGAGSLVAFGLGVFYLSVAMRWSANEFHLSGKWIKITLTVSIIIILVAFAVLTIYHAHWFWHSTLILGFGAIIQAAKAVQGLNQTETKRLCPSRYVFPVYSFKPGLNEPTVEIDNSGHMAAYGACLTMMLWGIAAAICLSPTWIGWAAYSGGLLCFLALSLDGLFTPSHAFWSAWKVAGEHPSMVEEARQSSILSQGRSGDRAYMGRHELARYLAGDVTDTGQEIPLPPNQRTVPLIRDHMDAIRTFWLWEERSQIDKMLHIRNMYEVAPSKAYEFGDERSRARAKRLRLELLDEHIRNAFDEQSRIMVTFQLRIIVGANALRKKNQVVIRDFLRRCKGRDDPLASLATMTPFKLIEWAQNPANLRMLETAKTEYLQGTAQSIEKADHALKTEKENAAKRNEARQKRKKDGGVDTKEVTAAPVVDRFRYLVRRPSFDVAELDIKAEAPDLVARQAAEKVAALLASRAARGFDRMGGFCDVQFPRVQDLNLLVTEGHSAPVDEKSEDKHDSSNALARENRSDSIRAAGATWKRVNEFADKPVVFDGGPDPRDIIQGELEDCYLLSALSVLARDQERIRKLFLIHEPNEYGIYAMQFFVDGEWRAVFVDDQFPVKDDGKLAFARCLKSNQLWVPIMEKCYAKLYDGYESIIGGLVHESLKDMTGGFTDEITLDSKSSAAFDGSLFERILTYHREGYLMGCGNPKSSARQFDVVDGIVQGHAYALLDVREVEGVKLVKLRNPWGESAWAGDWGDDSDKWTQKMRNLLDFTPQAGGVFWMSFEDFLFHFQKIYICRIFEHLHHDHNGTIAVPPTPSSLPTGVQPWYRRCVSGEWKGETAAGCPAFIKEGGRPELNPQWLISLDDTRPSVVFIVITQPTQSADAKKYVQFCIMVADKDGKRLRTVKNKEMLTGNLKFKNAREMGVEVRLEAGKKYTVFPSTFKPGEESTFTITAFCRTKFTLTPLMTTEFA